MTASKREQRSRQRRIEMTAQIMFEAMVSRKLDKLGFFRFMNRLFLGLEGNYVATLAVESSEEPGVSYPILTTLNDFKNIDQIRAFQGDGGLTIAHGRECLAPYSVRLQSLRRHGWKPGKRGEERPIFYGRRRYLFSGQNPACKTISPEIDGNGQALARKPYYHYHLIFFKVQSNPSGKGLEIDLGPAEVVDLFEDIIEELKNQFARSQGASFYWLFRRMVRDAYRGMLPGEANRSEQVFIPYPEEKQKPQILEKLQSDLHAYLEYFVEHQFRKIADYPFNRFEGFPVRFMFQYKSFVRRAPRFSISNEREGYHYENRLVLCHSQRQQILQALDDLRQSAISGRAQPIGSGLAQAGLDWPRKNLNISAESRFGYDPMGNMPVEDVNRPLPFVESCKASQTALEKLLNNRELILDVLESPLDDSQSLFSDSCLASGIVHFRKDVLGSQAPQFCRCSSSSKASSDSARLRDFCYQIIWTLMATTKSKKRHHLMLVPSRLGGASFGAISTIFGGLSKEERKNYMQGAKTFSRNWFFYNEVAVRFNSDLRRALMHYYNKVLGEEFAVALSALKSGVSHQVVFDEINCVTDALQRLLPFKRPILELTQQFSCGKVAPFPANTPVNIRFEENQFFSRFGDKEFHFESMCINAWNDAIARYERKTSITPAGIV